MRNAMMTACCFGLAALISTPANAQGQGRGMMGGMGQMAGPALLSNKSVQKELKLSDEQIAKADAAGQAYMAKVREKTSGLQDASADERREIMAEVQKMATTEGKKVVEDVLKPEQVKRFHQISLQARGIQAMEDPEVQAKLKITSEQKDKLKSIQDDSREKMTDMREKFQGDREGMMKAMTEMRKEVFEKAVGVLTSEQKSMWKEMTGEPFEIKMEAMRRPA